MNDLVINGAVLVVNSTDRPGGLVGCQERGWECIICGASLGWMLNPEGESTLIASYPSGILVIGYEQPIHRCPSMTRADELEGLRLAQVLFNGR